MIRGLYSSAAGMLASNLQVSDIANNIANAGTNGYLTVRPVLVPFAPLFLSRLQGGSATPLAEVSSGSAVGATVLDMSPGPWRHTGAPLAAAINGPGFFAVRTPQGVQYTRAGSFRLDAAGALVSPAGYAVLGANGVPVQVAAADRASAALSPDGAIRAGGRVVGQVGVFQTPAGALTPAGGGLYALAAGAAPAPVAAARLSPGWVEGSNVDLVQQMAALLQIQQAYTSDQEAVLTANTTMGEAINQVGTVP